MIAAWLRDLLNKARNKEPAPKQDHLPLTDFWINQMLQCEGDCIYEFSRAEPFRLRHVRASDTPITPALINRTVATVVGIMEPEQPALARDFCYALRNVTPDTPQQLRYHKGHFGVMRVATVFDLGPEHDRLYVHCQEESRGRPLFSSAAPVSLTSPPPLLRESGLPPQRIGTLSSRARSLLYQHSGG